MKVSSLAAATVVTLFAGGMAMAQSNYYIPPQPVVSPPTFYRHASTYQEGVLRGWADLGRAVGEGRYNSTLALINREEAIRRRLENRKQFAQDYFELRKLNADARFQSVERPTQEQLTRASRARLPDRLATHEFDRSLGTLNWPGVLEDDTFASERAAIDQAMAERAIDNSGVGSPTYHEVRTLVAQLESKLKGQLDQLDSSESIAARKFLQSVVYEASLPVSVDEMLGLAVR